MNLPTYKEIAESFNLWAQYVDPSATMTEEEFDAMSTEEKIAVQTKCFGQEPEPDEFNF